MNQFFLSKFAIVALACLGSSMLTLSAQSDLDFMTEFWEWMDFSDSPEVSPDQVVDKEGNLQFYFIDPYGRSHNTQIFVRTAEDYQAIMPATAALEPLHQMNAEGDLLFYQRQRVEAAQGETPQWHYYPVYSVPLSAYNGGVIAIMLSNHATGARKPDDPVLPLRWIDLSENFVNFGNFAIINSFDRPIAVQVDGSNQLLQPGENYRTRIRVLRRNTGVAHVRVAIQFADGNYRELSNIHLFMDARSRTVAIPSFDHSTEKIVFFEFMESPTTP